MTKSTRRITHLPPLDAEQNGRQLTFVIDGQDVASVTADRRGRAEVELQVRMPGAAASR